ncbi:hypothetical protein ACWEO4_39000 [Streptomyces sp. NPDC004393]|uniref:hypothetical protein n=1 Tax=Streptomyces sp. NPDC004533 TaxID=3154278 RepID=UPI0033B16B93
MSPQIIDLHLPGDEREGLHDERGDQCCTEHEVASRPSMGFVHADHMTPHRV